MKMLVIAPHPDDEVIGAGGTIARHVGQGDEVHLCIVTKAYTPDWSEESINTRRQEVLEVSEILGIKKVHFLDLPTVKLDTIPQKDFNDTVTKCVLDVQPEVVYTTYHGDINMDHRLVFEATMVATRPVPGCPVRKVLSYELLSSTEWGASLVDSSFVPDVYMDITDTLEIKLKAMAAYKTELKQFPHPRSLEAITALAKYRGSNAGLNAAEGFKLIMEIIKQ